MKKVFSNLSGKTVLIIGASSGLGEQIAYESARKGARVLLCARREDKLVEITRKCSKFSQLSCDYFSLDISNFEDVERKLNLIETKYPEIDVLVNCAGYGHFELFLDSDFNETVDMFQVNVLGLIYVTQKIGLMMAEKNEGHIINIASQAGKIATPKSSIYAATKFAVIGFSNSLRLEMKPLGIAVTTVNPGPIQTPFFDIADPNGTYLESVGRWVLNSEMLAKKIVSSMGTYKREINAPFIMEVGSKAYQLFPHIGDFLAINFFDKK